MLTCKNEGPNQPQPTFIYLISFGHLKNVQVTGFSESSLVSRLELLHILKCDPNQETKENTVEPWYFSGLNYLPYCKEEGLCTKQEYVELNQNTLQVYKDALAVCFYFKGHHFSDHLGGATDELLL